MAGNSGGIALSSQIEQNMNNGGMRNARFSPRTGDFPVLQTFGAGCTASRRGRCGAARYRVGQTFRRGGDGFCAVMPAGKCGTYSLGFRSHGAAREWAALWASFAAIRVQRACASSRGQPSAGRTVGHGRGRCLRRSVGGRGRDTWRAGSAELYRDQAVGAQVRGSECAGLVDQDGRGRIAVGGTRTLAAVITPLRCASLEPCGPRRACVGGGAVPCAWSRPRHMGGTP